MISLSATEVERRFLLMSVTNRFTDDERTEFDTTSIVDTDSRIIRFPTPRANSGLNVLNLRKILGTDPSKQPSFFDHPWYLDESFGLTDCAPGWHSLQVDVLPDSISQPIDYISSLRDRRLELPFAIEVVLMVFLHFVGTGEQLLQKKHTWCRDEASLKRFVTIGAFGRNGLFLSAHPGAYKSRGLGTCAKVIR